MKDSTRDALRLIRQPTIAMVDAGRDAMSKAEGYDPYLDFVRMWQAVIDAALKHDVKLAGDQATTKMAG